MFADPLVIASRITAKTTGTNYSFPRTGSSADKSTYEYFDDATGYTWVVTLGHQRGRRGRFTARVDVSGLTPDLIVDGQNSRFSQSCYVVFDCPITGAVDGITYPSIPNDMLGIVGNLLLSAAAAPEFIRVIKGET